MPITRLALRCMTHPAADQTIAEAIGLTGSRFSLCMTGKAALPPMLLMDLAWILDCDPEQLVGWADDGIDSPDLAAELPCLDNGVDTALPPRLGPGGRPVPA